jgi:hypothetical protein
VSGNVDGDSITLVEGCDIQAVSGNINLGFKNNAEDLHFNLNSLGGQLKINKGNTAVDETGSVKAGSGKITVKTNTSTGNQTYW